MKILANVIWFSRINPLFRYGKYSLPNLYNATCVCWFFSLVDLIAVAVLVISFFYVKKIFNIFSESSFTSIIVIVTITTLSLISLLAALISAHYGLKEEYDFDNNDPINYKCYRDFEISYGSIYAYAILKNKYAIYWNEDGDRDETIKYTGYLCADVGAPSLIFALVQIIGLCLFYFVVITSICSEETNKSIDEDDNCANDPINTEKQTTVQKDISTDDSISTEEQSTVQKDISTDDSISTEEQSTVQKDISTDDSISTEEQTIVQKNFSPDDPSGEDIFSYCLKRDTMFLTFACIGPMGIHILDGDENFHWEATENQRGNTEFNIGFNHYSVRLNTLRMFTGSDEFPEKAPHQFYLYGYNSHLKVWDIIYIFHGNRLKTHSCYDFHITDGYEKIPYRIFSLSTNTGPFALAYIKFFGELVPEDDEISKDIITRPDIIVEKKIEFNCVREPDKYTDGIFQAATKYYGPNLLYFVKTSMNSDFDDCCKFSDIWNERNKYFKTVKSEDRPSVVTFDFVHHEVFLIGYTIRPVKNTMACWCVVGCQNNQDPGVILDQRIDTVLEDEDSNYYFQFNKISDPNKSFRIIRVFGLNKYLAFRCLDFFGKVVPARDLTKEEYEGVYTYSGNVVGLFDQVNGK